MSRTQQIIMYSYEVGLCVLYHHDFVKPSRTFSLRACKSILTVDCLRSKANGKAPVDLNLEKVTGSQAQPDAHLLYCTVQPNQRCYSSSYVP